MPSANVRLNVKDIPEHGLRIIAPSDPAYSSLVSQLLPVAPSASLQALLPYTVILNNTSERTVLDYKESKRTDEFGNHFRYRAKVRDAKGTQAGRWAWDVFLITR
jgi:hypothetical protein